MRTKSENASERLQIRERGDARAHECLSMDVDEPCDEVQLVLPKAECTSQRSVLRTLDIQCPSASCLCDMSTTTSRAAIVDSAGFPREKRETAREGTREPVNKEEQCQQQVSNTRRNTWKKNGTQCFKSGSQRQLGQQVYPGRRDHSRRSRPCGLDNLKRMCEIPVSCSLKN